MSLAYALKVLCDAVYYFTIVSMFGPAAGQSGMVVTTPVLCGVAAYGCHLLVRRQPRWLRFLPLASMALAFVFTRSTADVVLSVPPIVYTCWYVWKRPLTVDYRDAVSRFYLCLKILPCVFVFAALFGNWTAMRDIVLPYFMMFLVLSVILLRMLRHDAATISQPRFQLLNLSGIAAVGLAGVLLSTGVMLRIFRFFGWCIVNILLRPVMMLVVYVFAGFVWLLSRLFTGIKFDPEDLDLQKLGENMELGGLQGLFGEGEGTEQATSPIGEYIMIGLAVIAAIALVIIIFRALAKHGHRGDDNEFADVREQLTDEEAPERVNPRENRQRVRHYYRKFLKLCTQRGFELTEFQNSAEIEHGTRHLFKNPAQAALRDIYVRARYSSAEITPEDVQAAKENYTKLKKNEL